MPCSSDADADALMPSELSDMLKDSPFGNRMGEVSVEKRRLFLPLFFGVMIEEHESNTSCPFFIIVGECQLRLLARKVSLQPSRVVGPPLVNASAFSSRVDLIVALKSLQL